MKFKYIYLQIFMILCMFGTVDSILRGPIEIIIKKYEDRDSNRFNAISNRVDILNQKLWDVDYKNYYYSDVLNKRINNLSEIMEQEVK